MQVNENVVHGYAVFDAVKVLAVLLDPPANDTVNTCTLLKMLRVAAANDTVYVRAVIAMDVLVIVKVLEAKP